MSYLLFDGFTLKILCIARPNRGTSKASGSGTRRRDVARARVHASPPHLSHAPSYHNRTLMFGCEHGMRQHRMHLQAESRPVSPRARRGTVRPPTAPARRGSPYPLLNAKVASL
jgi:hypothetical protein